MEKKDIFRLKREFSTTRLVGCYPPCEREGSVVLSVPVSFGKIGEGGIRKKGYFKYSYRKGKEGWYAYNLKGKKLFEIDSLPVDLKDKEEGSLPLITVITVVLNAVDRIERTIKSVLSQTYPNVEYIIVDGGSTDGTVDIIKSYNDCIDYWISEPDAGIYDAMNKGILLATGEWISFMNAGDTFYDNEVIEFFFEKDRAGCDVLYGNWIESFGEYQRFREPEDLSYLWKGMVFSHNASFVRAEIMKRRPFDASYRIAADFDFFLSAFKDGYRFCYVDKTASVFYMDGVSRADFKQALMETWKAARKINKSRKVDIYYLWQYYYLCLSRWLQKVLPKRIVKFILINKYRFLKALKLRGGSRHRFLTWGRNQNYNNL